jgi:hypothetical protein
MHGVPARFVEAVEVDERHEGKPVWQPERRQMRFVPQERSRRISGRRRNTTGDNPAAEPDRSLGRGLAACHGSTEEIQGPVRERSYCLRGVCTR